MVDGGWWAVGGGWWMDGMVDRWTDKRADRRTDGQTAPLYVHCALCTQGRVITTRRRRGPCSRAFFFFFFSYCASCKLTPRECVCVRARKIAYGRWEGGGDGDSYSGGALHGEEENAVVGEPSSDSGCCCCM